MFQDADIGAAPLFITPYRSKVVDFTAPYLMVQSTVLLRKPPSGQSLHIKSVTDLINQSEIKYGTLKSGLLMWSFRNTNESTYRIMYRNMLRFKPSVFTLTNEDGIHRVRHEK